MVDIIAALCSTLFGWYAQTDYTKPQQRHIGFDPLVTARHEKSLKAKFFFKDKILAYLLIPKYAVFPIFHQKTYANIFRGSAPNTAVDALKFYVESRGSFSKKGNGQTKICPLQACLCPTYWNTAFGLSKLSEPSIATPSAPTTATARSIFRVCATSLSMAACTSAPPGCSAPSIWS